jgi:nucleolar complex protein 2
MDPEQNIVAEGLDEEEDEDMSEDDEEEEEDEDEYESIDEEEEDDGMEEDEVDEDDDSILVTAEMLKEWTVAANKKSPAAWKKMLMAFRSFVRSDEASKTKFTYRVESSKGTHQLIL